MVCTSLFASDVQYKMLYIHLSWYSTPVYYIVILHVIYHQCKQLHINSIKVMHYGIWCMSASPFDLVWCDDNIAHHICLATDHMLCNGGHYGVLSIASVLLRHLQHKVIQSHCFVHGWNYGMYVFCVCVCGVQLSVFLCHHYNDLMCINTLY